MSHPGVLSSPYQPFRISNLSTHTEANGITDTGHTTTMVLKLEIDTQDGIHEILHASKISNITFKSKRVLAAALHVDLLPEQQFPFMELPEELRFKVIQSATNIGKPIEFIPPTVPRSKSWLFRCKLLAPNVNADQYDSEMAEQLLAATRLLRVSKDVSQTSLKCFYRANDFRFESNMEISSFFTKTPSGLPYIRRLTITTMLNQHHNKVMFDLLRKAHELPYLHFGRAIRLAFDVDSAGDFASTLFHDSFPFLLNRVSSGVSKQRLGDIFIFEPGFLEHVRMEETEPVATRYKKVKQLFCERIEKGWEEEKKATRMREARAVRSQMKSAKKAVDRAIEMLLLADQSSSVDTDGAFDGAPPSTLNMAQNPDTSHDKVSAASVSNIVTLRVGPSLGKPVSTCFGRTANYVGNSSTGSTCKAPTTGMRLKLGTKRARSDD